MRRLWLAGLPIAVCWFAAPIHAALNFDFGNPAGNRGSSQSYTSGAVTITAYGFTNGGSASDLFGKNAGGDESGLGMFNDAGADNEIDISHFIALDLSNIANGTNLLVSIGSMVGQTGEGYNFYEKNAAPSGGIGTYTSIVTNQTNATYSFTKTSSIESIAIQAANVDGNHPLANVLISTLSTAPEPGFYGVLSLGLGLMYLVRRRRRSAL